MIFSQPRLALFSLLILGASLLAEEITSEHNPIYAGTMLAFYPQNAQPGKLSVEPFLFATRKYGFYTNQWTPPKQKHFDQLSMLIALETGITDYLDFSLDLTGAYSYSEPYHTWLYGDTTAFLGFQIFQDQKNKVSADLRFLIGETFPTGKYDRLNPDKNGSDIFGNGTYATTFLLVLAKTFYWLPKHPFNFNLNLFYILSAPSKVNGFNCYGGAFDTQGKVKPGDQCITNLAIQYSLDRRWVIGLDLHYLHQNKSPFSGKKGSLADGSLPLTRAPSSEQFSLAPCLEYSWSEDFSVALGPWFTVSGRNSVEFMSATGNVFYYF